MRTRSKIDRERETTRTIRKLEEKIGHRDFCIAHREGNKKNIQEILFKKKINKIKEGNREGGGCHPLRNKFCWARRKKNTWKGGKKDHERLKRWEEKIIQKKAFKKKQLTY